MQSIVLLKNDGALLPLAPAKLKSIAVIGSAAVEALIGGLGSSEVNPVYTVNPADAIRTRLGSGVDVRVSDGSDVGKAADLARTADVAVVFVKDVGAEAVDRSSSTLPDPARPVDRFGPCGESEDDRDPQARGARGDAVARADPPLVEAWYGGEEDGNVITAILFGDASPSGRLPATIPKKLADAPTRMRLSFPVWAA